MAATPVSFAPSLTALFAVAGTQAKRDRIYAHLGCDRAAVERCVYFIPGDIQSWTAEMQRGAYAELAARFSLEAVAAQLFERFGRRADVWVVAPTHFGLDGASEFHHLLRPGHCLRHLAKTTDAARAAARIQFGCEIRDDLPITLLAFSKGALVLNCACAEMALLDAVASGAPRPHDKLLDWEDPALSALLPLHEPSQRIARLGVSAAEFLADSAAALEFARSVRVMHWLDCHRFPTEPFVVRHLAHFCGQHELTLRLTGSPRQLADSRRGWIALEWESLVRQLAEQRCVCETRRVLTDAPMTLETHFEVLYVFDDS